MLWLVLETAYVRQGRSDRMWVREVVRCQGKPNLVGWIKEFEFFSEYDMKPLMGFEPKNAVTYFIFYQNYSGYSMYN